MQNRQPNALIHATSPYLLQHAYNPVRWQEWNDDSLAQAVRENKPIVVSIGYSSCHWCHVMEHQSFENDDIADIMNEYFVCIKVDREERPDIDHLYMDAVQAMGQNGGWPLNVFLTPDQKPFYGGTYYPPAAWAQLLTNIHKMWVQRRDDIFNSAESLAAHLADMNLDRFRKQSDQEFQEQLTTMFQQLAQKFDHTDGGLDKAPKFIMPSVWQWTLRHHYLTGNPESLAHTLFTLRRIAMGGIYDQLGGGFARYSVDGHWFVPHFEKMLYDNAQLLSLYSEAYRISRDPFFKTVIDETAGWLMRDMRSQEGAFYSALDADSEGVEGKFYCWTHDELQSLLPADDFELFCFYYGVTPEGNWEHGLNILKRDHTDADVAARFQLDVDTMASRLAQCREQLLALRATRVHPGLDDKLVTAWNALAITGFTDAWRATGNLLYYQQAQETAHFLMRHVYDGQVLYRSFKQRRSTTTGFLEDYACMIQALINLYQMDFDEQWIQQAEALMNYTLTNFFDEQENYFLYSSKQAAPLIANRKELFDNVIPSSNSIMARNLWQLGTLLDRDDWKALATTMVQSISALIVSEPNYMSNWGIALQEISKGLAEVAFVGPDAAALHRSFCEAYHPLALTYGTATATTHMPLLAGKYTEGSTHIYVCRNKTCQLPVTSVADAEAQL